MYQRRDSIWANQYRTSLSDHAAGFRSNRCQILSVCVRCDFETDQPEEIRPAELPVVARAKSERELADYFKAYRQRALLDFLKYSFEKKADAIFCSHVTEESIAHRLAKNA
jgi:hypothetical protein